MAALLLLTSILWINIKVGVSQCVPSCESTQYCSIWDFKCYDVFTESDYAAYSLYLGGADTGLDITNLFDANSSSLVTVDASSGTLYTLTVEFPSKYWLHYISIDLSTTPNSANIYIDDNQTDSTTSASVHVQTYLLPLNGQKIEFEFYKFGFGTTYDIYDVNIYGSDGTPMPSESPTMEPTTETVAPTDAPSMAPSDAPSMAPTPYPTPDVCEEHYVRQSCCGHYDYMIDYDAVNMRNESDQNCERDFVGGCCGDFALTGSITPDRQFYGCGGALDNWLCNATFYDNSLIIGEVIDGELLYFPVDNESIPDLELMTFENCECTYTVYECNGTDMAICGSMADFEDLFDEPCWANQTWMSYENDSFIEDECYEEVVDENDYYDHLSWEPCSEDSFIGQVSAILNITKERIFEDDCSCTYYIKDCKLTDSHQHSTDMCKTEIIDTCCGDNSTATGNVSPSGFDMYAYPTNWTCTNNETICPDIWNGTRYYEVDYTVDWWYDDDTGEIERRCGCRYILDECNFPPTTEPTGAPTTEPTDAYTPEPTPKPVWDEESALHSSLSLITIISLMSLYCIF